MSDCLTYDIEVVYDTDPEPRSPVFAWILDRMIATEHKFRSGCGHSWPIRKNKAGMTLANMVDSRSNTPQNGAEIEVVAEDYLRFRAWHYCERRNTCIGNGERLYEAWRHRSPRPRERWVLILSDGTRKSRRQMSKDVASLVAEFSKRGAQVSVT